MPESKPWNNKNPSKNLLCVRLDNIGDLLMTTPALRALKTSVRGRKITLLTSSAAAPIVPMVPEIDDVIIFDAPWVKNKIPADALKVLKETSNLESMEFDAAVIFTTFSQSALPAALMCYLARIPRILGYARENPYQLMTDWLPDPEPRKFMRHEVARQLDLVKSVGAETDNQKLSLIAPNEAVTSMRYRLEEMGVELDGLWLVMHPAASEAKRRYYHEGFAEVGLHLINEGWQIILVGSSEEKEYVARIAEAFEGAVFNLAGELTAVELAALISLAPVVLANNSGPVHMAAALQTPAVVLYAKTNPQHTPWQSPSRVLYFDVPQALRSQNQLLQNFEWPDEAKATPVRIVHAVNELAKNRRPTTPSGSQSDSSDQKGGSDDGSIRKGEYEIGGS